MNNLNNNGITWKELDGRETIVCNSEDLKQLVIDNYKNKFRPGLKYYRVVCPRCLDRNRMKGEYNYDHRNLSINKEFTFGFCFRCEGIYVDEMSGATSKVDTEINSFRGSSIYDFNIERINTEPYDKALPISLHTDAIKYITNRNKYYNITTDQFKLRYKTNKIIIPYMDLSGTPFYYQFRYIDVTKSPTNSKYFNAVINNKPIYIAPDSIGKPVWKVRNDTILVEGALTAIALKIVLGDSVNVVCIMGKVPTLYQITFLKWLGLVGNVYVMMDETSLSSTVVGELVTNKIHAKIIPSDGRDAEEMLMSMGIDNYREYLKLNMGKDRYLTFDSIYSKSDDCTVSDINKELDLSIKF